MTISTMKKPSLKTESSTKSDEKKEFVIGQVYIKSSRFDGANLSSAMKKEWTPEVKMDLRSDYHDLKENDLHEVNLQITLNIQNHGEFVAMVQLTQTGIFQLKGYTTKEMEPIFKAFCPQLLLPFARQAAANMMTQGGLQPFMIAPINFDALYQQHLEEAKKQEK